MKWNIFFEIKTPDGLAQASCLANPIEAVGICEVLYQVDKYLPPLRVGEVVGVKIRAEDAK